MYPLWMLPHEVTEARFRREAMVIAEGAFEEQAVDPKHLFGQAISFALPLVPCHPQSDIDTQSGLIRL